MTDSFMREAINLSIRNVQSGRGGPFGCVIVKSNRIIASGTNLVTQTNDPTAHAEIVAIREACNVLQSFQLTDCDVYASCEPCPMCLAALYWARPAKLFYAATREDATRAGFDDSHIYSQLSLPVGERIIPMIPMMRDEALDALRQWSAKDDRTPY
jgi:tRNA(Arg) A34 adenosine deaminase TadA